MNCDWSNCEEYLGPSAKWQARCGRCDLTTAPTSHECQKIHSECRAWPRSWEWGHWLALFIEAAGMSAFRWNWLRRRFGFVEPCKCEERKAWLNSLPGRIVRVYRWVRSWKWPA